MGPPFPPTKGMVVPIVTRLSPFRRVGTVSYSPVTARRTSKTDKAFSGRDFGQRSNLERCCNYETLLFCSFPTITLGHLPRYFIVFATRG
jgi:hypothetical protein